MRKFIFLDKSDYEKEIIIDLLHSEGIKYCVKREYIEIPCDCGDEDCECFEFLPNYQIETYTTVEKFEFIKVLLTKKIDERNKLEDCFNLKIKKTRKRVKK